MQAELAVCCGNTNVLSQFKGFLTEFKLVLFGDLFDG
jgi:hypothetical protein